MEGPIFPKECRDVVLGNVPVVRDGQILTPELRAAQFPPLLNLSTVKKQLSSENASQFFSLLC